MPKELIISVTPQETKASILDNEQVVEIYIEREKEQSIVGSICKGRVTKVLPGMQSAFVDIGLERDAFLYVSDFFEDTEEYDKIVTSAEEQVAKLEQGVKETHPPVEPEAAVSADSQGTQPGGKFVDRRGRTRRARRSRLRGKRYDEAATETVATPPPPAINPEPPAEAPLTPILPGESLAKYQGAAAIIEESPVPLDLEEDENSLETESTLVEEEEEGDEEDLLPAEPEVRTNFEGDFRAPSETGESSELSAEAASEEKPIAESESSSQLKSAAPQESLILSSESAPVSASVIPAAATATAGEKPEPHEATSISLEKEATSPLPVLTVESAVERSGEDLKALTPDMQPEPVEAASPAPMEEKESVKTPPAASSNKEVNRKESYKTIADTVDNPAEAPIGIPSPVMESPELASGEKPVSATPENESPAPASTAPAQNRPAPSNKAEFRNPSGNARFYRHGPENRRRPHGHRDRKENGGGEDFPLIADLLKEGQEILVQVAKEPLGTKGARITSHIALPGRYLVYMPTVEHIGVSRKIDSDEERQRLKRIIQEQRGHLSGGFIVRTAGQGRGEDEFKSDIQYLSALWADIKAKTEKRAAPAIIHRDLNLVQRLLRDHLSPDFTAIRVDNEVEYAGILEFVNRFMPSMVSKVKLFLKEVPIFEEFGVQSEIDKALRSKVWLKSGGYIVIDHAEALVAIDVNTGKYVGKSNKLEDTIVKTNLEAAKEIARQIRMRDLGGIIVCDFIDMEDRKNRQKVTQALEEALRGDKSPSKILQFNDFGLVAITRKRVKQSLLKTLCEPCSSCNGLGMVKSAQTICYEIQSEVRKMAKALDEREITLRVNPAVAKALKTTEASVITEIETTLKKEVVIKSDPILHQEHFDIF
jgi:ribonuclease G